MSKDARLDNPSDLPEEFKEWLLRYLDQKASLQLLQRVAAGGGQRYTETNVTTDRTYDADATSTAELADILGTLIKDLRVKGIVG